MAELLEVDGLGVRYRVLGGWRAMLTPGAPRLLDAVIDQIPTSLAHIRGAVLGCSAR